MSTAAIQRRLRGWPGDIGWPLVGTATALTLWLVATHQFGVQGYLLSPPQDVARALVELPGFWIHHTGITVSEVAAGYVLAVAIGVPTGLLLASWRPVRLAVAPLLVMLHAIPKHPLAVPLVVILGFGAAPKIVLVVLISIFPIVLSTVTGLKSTPADLEELARSMRASQWKTHLKIRMPHAVPHIMVGLKQAAPLAVVGATIGELFGALGGLGHVIRGAGTDLPLVWAALLLLGLISLALYYIVVAIERLAVSWAPHHTT